MLAHPASIASIPTSAGQEDFVSMGATSAIKLEQVMAAARDVIAIELLCAAQGLDFRAPLRPGQAVATAHARMRALVPTLTTDRPPAPDIARLSAALAAGLLDDLIPEDMIDSAPHATRRATRKTNGHANGNAAVSATPTTAATPREPGADGHGRGRH